jgi:RHS repeat-associated protein
MVATAPSAPSSLAGPSAQGRGASRIASDRQGAAWGAPENAAFEHLARRPEHAAAARCIGGARPHRRDSHRGRRRFSGQTRGGRYSWARYYHPQLQRFIAEDPIGFEGGDVNLYAYVANNPLRWTDPLGLRTGSVCVKLSIGGFGFGGGGGTCVNLGYDRKQGFSASLSGTAGAGGFAGFGGAVGISVGGSNAPTVFDLTGGSVSLGAGGGVGVVGGGNVWTSTNPQIQGAEGFIGYGLKLNPALAVPVAVEGYLNTTSTILGYGSRRGPVGPSQ